MTESSKLLTITVTLILLVITIGVTTTVMVIQQQEQQALAQRIADTNLDFALDEYNGELISGSAIYAMIARGVHVYNYTSEPLTLNASHITDLTGASALTRESARTIGIAKTNWYRVYRREHKNGIQVLVVIIP